MKAQDIIQFWFHEIDRKKWFQSSPEFDQQIRDRFLKTFHQVQNGSTSQWRETPEGRLAEIIVLDQFSRNMFRDKPEAFAADPLALELAKAAVTAGDDMKLPVEQRGFLYMPYMHSENADDHIAAMKLFSQKGLENNYQYELLHKKIIDRFGRYPHRNQVLGRKSTPEELEFLKEKNSSF
ncbi:MAG: DUF924 family protein [Bdellovibrionales bacterium]